MYVCLILVQVNSCSDSVQPQHGLGDGDFDLSLLDIYDDFMASVYRISGGKTKVLLALHDANNIRHLNSLPCDTFCQAIGGDGTGYTQFYTDQNRKFRDRGGPRVLTALCPVINAYKVRLHKFLAEYRSKNFNGASWNTLSEVLIGIDLQNEPWVTDYPIPSGQEDWICDIAGWLKNDLGLGAHNIAVFSGGISGGRGPLGYGNAPDAALTCDNLDVIALHAYLNSGAENVDQQWYDLLIQGGDFRNRMIGVKKLPFIEEWAYEPGNPSYTKPGDVWAQGHSLNVRGVPWTYWDVMTGNENCNGCESKEISVDNGAGSAWEALQTVLKEAPSFQTEFDWSKYID